MLNEERATRTVLCTCTTLHATHAAEPAYMPCMQVYMSDCDWCVPCAGPDATLEAVSHRRRQCTAGAFEGCLRVSRAEGTPECVQPAGRRWSHEGCAQTSGSRC